MNQHEQAIYRRLARLEAEAPSYSRLRERRKLESDLLKLQLAQLSAGVNR